MARFSTDILKRLLMGDEEDQNVGIATAGIVDTAMQNFLKGGIGGPPSQMDTVLGSSIGSHISHQFGPNVLAQPIAMQTLKARAAANKKTNPLLPALSPFDFVAAASTQRNAEFLNILLGRRPEAGGVREPGHRGLEAQLTRIPHQPFVRAPGEPAVTQSQTIYR